MRKAGISIGLLLLLLAVPAGASERVTARANCGSGNEAAVAVIPTPEIGDYATFVGAWRKSNIIVIAALLCDDLGFGAWVADSEGSFHISGGTFGSLCILAVCTLGGSDKLTIGAFFGRPDPTLGRFSAGTRADELPERTLFQVDVADFPEASEMLGRLAERRRIQMRAARLQKDR